LGDPARDSAAKRAHALVGYTLAALVTAAVAADVAGIAAGAVVGWVIGAHLLTASLVVAVPAALPGLLRHRTLPRSRGRRRSAVHGILVFAPLFLLALARWLRGHPEVPPDPPILAAELVAAVLVAGGVVAGRRIGERHAAG
jgi:uncharacterized membrane protein